MRNLFLKVVIIFTGISAGCSNARTESKGETQTSPSVTNDLPALRVIELNGSVVELKALKNMVVLILFQPDCDHCQREAEQIRDHISAFKAYQVYFVSSGPKVAIEKFGTDYHLLGNPNIHFASATVDNIVNTLGPIPAPSLYIYSNQQLVQKFNGEATIEQILKYL